MPLTVQNRFKRFHITFPPRVPGLREVDLSGRAYALCNIAHSPEEEEGSRSTAAAVPVMTYRTCSRSARAALCDSA